MMINFFRQIRRKLADENEFVKYSRYAIGEILLVMVGILLALQVNNWNEFRKDRNFENKMLKEVSQALESDLSHYNRMIRRMTVADSAVIELIHYYHNKASFNDSMYATFRRLRTGIQWQHNYGPYQSIKSVGMDKISNDKLREELVEFYDFVYPRNEELIIWSDKTYDEENNEINNFRNKPYTTILRDSIVIYRDFKPDIFTNPDFLDLLRRFKTRIHKTRRTLQDGAEEIEEMLELLEHENGKF